MFHLFCPRSNLGQYKMDQLSPSPQSNDEGAKAHHFYIIEMEGGVVQMFHLLCPRL